MSQIERELESATAGRSTKIARVRGVALMVLGPLIAAACIWALVELIKDSRGGSLEAGIEALLAGGAVLGVTFVAAGWQLWQRGRVNGRLALAVAALVALLFVLLHVVRRLTH